MLEYWYYIVGAILLVVLVTVQEVIRRRAMQAEREPEEAAQDADPRAFRCYIENKPFTLVEEVQAMGGVFQATLREAVARGTEEGLAFETREEGGPLIAVGTIPWRELSHYEAGALTMGSQLFTSLLLSMGVGLMLSVVLLVMVMSQVDWGIMVNDPGRAAIVILGLLVAGPVLGLLFSLVPNLFRLRADLTEFVLCRKEGGGAVVLSLDATQHEKAARVLAEFKLERKTRAAA